MGADLTKEYPSTWNQDDVQKWKKKGLDALKAYYLSFRGSQWNEFDRSKDTLLLRAQVCFALYGNPASYAENIENAYEECQRKKAGEILEVILKVFDDSRVKNLRVGFIFVACKQEQREFVVPIFSVYVGEDNKGSARRMYIDTQSRVYKDWDDWKDNNRLPMLKYAYPTRGFFTCSGNDQVEFSETQDPDVAYGTSPACDASSRILRQTDNVTAVASLGAGIVGIIGLFTPLAPVVLVAVAVTGGSSAVYGTARGITRLVDKGQHKESLVDLESFTLWFGLAATPLHFATSFVNGTLALGAQQGRIFSSSMRTFATVLNFTTLGVDGVMMAFGLGNLIQKSINDELTPLDVLQFSMSVLFFTNTLIQPKVARSIIQKAQDQHIGRYMNTMTNEQAKAALKNFLDQNKGQGTITDASKVIRTLNRMENANGFFKNVGLDAKVEIGGRKGRTVLLTRTDGNTNRINPNRTIVSNDSFVPGSYDFRRDSRRLGKCYGMKREDVELNGEKIFSNLSEMEKRRVGKAFGGSARNFNKDIVATAHSISESMGFRTADDLMSIIEILAAEVSGKSGIDLEAALVDIGGAGRNSFISDVRNDIAAATQCANNAGLKFENPLTAVYHYRKHGAEFPQLMRKFGGGIDVYLGPVADKVFNDSNLKETCFLPNSKITRKIYATSSDQFGVTTTTPDGIKISTMFKKPGYNQDFVKGLADYLKEDLNKVETVYDSANRLTRFLGLSEREIRISIDGKSTPIDQCTDLDSFIRREIAHVLAAFYISL